MNKSTDKKKIKKVERLDGRNKAIERQYTIETSKSRGIIFCLGHGTIATATHDFCLKMVGCNSHLTLRF